MLGPQHLKRPPMVTAASSTSSLGIRPQGPLTRPSFSRSGSSSSSLSGLEQTVLPFQEFIKQTRPIDAEKPLPPTPLVPRHSFDSAQYSEGRYSPSFDPPRPAAARRSSSVYSRTQSQWIPDNPSLQSLEIEEESYMQPESYNMNIPGVNIRQPTPDYQELRECSPLIASPSPTLSAVSTLPKSRPLTLILDPPMVQERPKVRMMSLDKANRTFNAPGVVHMLPEELRAQSSKKADARKHTRMNSSDMFGSPRPPPLPPAAFDYRGERSHSTSTGASVSPCSPSPRDSAHQSPGSSYMTSMNSFHVGTGPVRNMAPPSAPETPRRSEDDEQRGRTIQRGRASREYAAPQKFSMHDLNPRAIPERLDNPYRLPSESGSYNSEDDVRGHMKLIPQPLFQAKSPIQHRKPSIAGSASSLGISPFRMQRSSQESASSARSSGFPLRLSLTPSPDGVRHRESNNSTTGMIPISPPSENVSRRPSKPHPIITSQRISSRSRLKDEARVSSLYPHIMGRSKKKRTKADIKPVAKRPSIGTPLLPADVVAAVLLTPEATPQTTPQTSPLASNVALMNSLKRAPSNISADGKKHLYQRFKGITKLRRGSKPQDLSPEESPVASPQSPHLFASPVKALTPTHLGWSDTAKATWDQARSTAFPSRSNASQTASPNEDGGVMDGVEGSNASRPTLFGPFMESYRETKAQKRRENLKRTIKVVTPLEGGSEAGESDSGGDGNSPDEKQLNDYNWM